jgi:hypothetical protein
MVSSASLTHQRIEHRYLLGGRKDTYHVQLRRQSRSTNKCNEACSREDGETHCVYLGLEFYLYAKLH